MAQVLSLKFAEAAAPPARPYLGEVLVRSGRLAPDALAAALSAQRGQDTLLGTILLAQGLLSADALADALSEQSGLARIDLAREPPEPIVLQGVDPFVCLRLDAIPW